MPCLDACRGSYWAITSKSATVWAMPWVRLLYSEPPDLPDVDLGTEGPQFDALVDANEDDEDSEPRTPADIEVARWLNELDTRPV